MSDRPDERALVQRLRAGDQRAWRDLYAEAGPKIAAFVRHLLKGDYHDAEEVTLQAFQRFHRGIAEFKADCSVATYLGTIARNLAYNRYHRRRLRREHLHLDAPHGEDGATLANVIPCPHHGPADHAELGEITEALRDALPRISPAHREILTLRIRGRSYVEIAGLLALSVGTVKSRIARARDCLREAMPLAS